MRRQFKVIVKSDSFVEAITEIQSALHPYRYTQHYFLGHYLVQPVYTSLVVDAPKLSRRHLMILELKLSRWLK